VKQCDHCRTARKSKSHHAKCDCGHKKTKSPLEKSESSEQLFLEEHDSGCLCHSGDACSCGSKPESAETRQGRQPARPRPALASNNSEPKLLVRTNGHHAPIHRNNNLAHTSGAPYQARKAKRATIHGPISLEDSTIVQSPNFSYSQDDLSYKLSYSGTYSTSEENLLSPSNSQFKYEDTLGLSSYLSINESSSSYDNSLAQSWPSASYPGLDLSSGSQTTLLATSPNFEYSSGDLASANTFLASELPLMSPMISTFPQNIFSDVYNEAMPALTNASSIPSEIESSSTATFEALTGSSWPEKAMVRNNSGVSTTSSDFTSGGHGNALRTIDSYTSLHSADLESIPSSTNIWQTILNAQDDSDEQPWSGQYYSSN
jgi:hypothetical protein